MHVNIVQPFRIDIAQAPLDYLKELAKYWRSDDDWRREEAQPNEIPQFATSVDGQRIHFLHVHSPEPDALLLMLIHGWPGSVVELLHLIGPLTDPRSHGGEPGDDVRGFFHGLR